MAVEQSPIIPETRSVYFLLDQRIWCQAVEVETPVMRASARVYLSKFRQLKIVRSSASEEYLVGRKIDMPRTRTLVSIDPNKDLGQMPEYN